MRAPLQSVKVNSGVDNAGIETAGLTILGKKPDWASPLFFSPLSVSVRPATVDPTMTAVVNSSSAAAHWDLLCLTLALCCFYWDGRRSAGEPLRLCRPQAFSRSAAVTCHSGALYTTLISAAWLAGRKGVNHKPNNLSIWNVAVANPTAMPRIRVRHSG